MFVPNLSPHKSPSDRDYASTQCESLRDRHHVLTRLLTFHSEESEEPQLAVAKAEKDVHYFCMCDSHYAESHVVYLDGS